ncbi:ABC transporter ATP-binding protein [Paenibacillus sp. PAMC21692]|uniref:ABC transporter ATP-binding protein n=1 Tax=Paenibacillus sp. PAMC21692 TaxID=2762320 RepID=UPI00164DBA03|nr:ABC transporter ATP-binding protein [Paenibacillus sp. PAMC21692]QNK59334.1 ABC transporter ATP-binding protein [Paenibacillus sp. PAMC21692]
MSTLLEVSGLSRSFGSVQAVKGIEFSVGEGRCVALLGPNGAGKTTTIRMLAGLLKPTSGAIKYAGQSERADVREGIGYLPQSPAFYPWMTGQEFAIYAGKLCGLGGREAGRSAGEWLERVGLKDAAKRKIGGYSGGMKQRLGLAQALIHRPKLLIMDEPVSALDPVGRREVLELIRELKRETTVLFSTHVLHDAEELCEDIIIINKGDIALNGSLEGIRNSYRKPIIELTMEPDEGSSRWARELVASVTAGHGGNNPLLADAVLQGNELRFTVREMEEARAHLLRSIVDNEVKLIRLQAGYSTLEDLFMKVVRI